MKFDDKVKQLWLTVYTGSSQQVRRIFQSPCINNTFCSKQQYEKLTELDFNEQKSLQLKKLDFTRKELLFQNIFMFESQVITNKKEFKENISLLGQLNNKNRQEIKNLFKKLGDVLLCMTDDETYYEEDLVREFLEHIFYCLEENPQLFYNMHNLLENFAYAMLTKYFWVESWRKTLINILASINSHSNESTFNEVVSMLLVNYKAFMELQKLNIISDKQAMSSECPEIREDFDKISKNIKLDLSGISNEHTENRFERFLNPKLKLQNSSKLKLKFFFPQQTKTQLELLKNTFYRINKNFRVNFNSAIEMCTDILLADSMNYEVNAMVHQTFIENKCKLLEILSIIISKSNVGKYSVYSFMSNIHSQMHFKMIEKGFLLKVLDFMIANIKKFPVRFYYDIVFETVNILDHLPTIVLSDRMSQEEKDITTVRINTKKVKQISLFTASTVGIFDAFWSNVDKVYKDKYVVKIQQLLDRVFDEILIDLSFQNNLISKIISTFTVFFLSNIKQFLTLPEKEKVLIVSIICKSAKICYKDGAKKDKCFDLDYIRKVNSFVTSLCDIDICESNTGISNIRDEYLNYLQEKEQNYYLLDKRVLEDEFYEGLEKEFEVIKKNKLDELTKSYEENILATQEKELAKLDTNQNEQTKSELVNKETARFQETQNDQNDSWANLGFSFNKAEDLHQVQTDGNFKADIISTSPFNKQASNSKNEVITQKNVEKEETNFLDFQQNKDADNGEQNKESNEDTENQNDDLDYEDIENMPELIQ